MRPKRPSPRCTKVVEALFAEGNPTGVKCALSILGLIGNRLRLAAGRGVLRRSKRACGS